MNAILSLSAKIREKGNAIIIKCLKENDLDDLCPSHGDILNILYQNEKVSMLEISNAIHKTKGTTTTLVNKLEQKGFVLRAVNKNDNRSIYVSLTNKGKALKPFFEKVSLELDDMVSKNLTNEEIKFLEKTLAKIIEN